MTAPNVNPDVEQTAVFDPAGPSLSLIVDVDNAPAAANCRLFARNPATGARFRLTKDPEWIDLRAQTPLVRALPFDPARLDGIQVVCEGSIMLGTDPTPDVRFSVTQGGDSLGTITFPDGAATDEAFLPFFLVFDLAVSA